MSLGGGGGPGPRRRGRTPRSPPASASPSPPATKRTTPATTRPAGCRRRSPSAPPTGWTSWPHSRTSAAAWTSSPPGVEITSASDRRAAPRKQTPSAVRRWPRRTWPVRRRCSSPRTRRWTPQQVRDAVVTSGVAGRGLRDVRQHRPAAARRCRCRSTGAPSACGPGSTRVSSSPRTAATKPLIARSWVLGRLGEVRHRRPAGGGLVALKSKANNRYVVGREAAASKPLVAREQGHRRLRRSSSWSTTSTAASASRRRSTASTSTADATRPVPHQAADRQEHQDRRLGEVRPRGAEPGRQPPGHGNNRQVRHRRRRGRQAADRPKQSVGGWEKFELVDLGYGQVALRAHGQQAST